MVSCPTCRATVLRALKVALAGAQHMTDISKMINAMIGRHMTAEPVQMTSRKMTTETLVRSEGVVTCEFNSRAAEDRDMTRIKPACAAPTIRKKMRLS